MLLIDGRRLVLLISAHWRTEEVYENRNFVQNMQMGNPKELVLKMHDFDQIVRMTNDEEVFNHLMLLKTSDAKPRIPSVLFNSFRVNRETARVTIDLMFNEKQALRVSSSQR